jgi:hypothetical protein
MNTMIVSVDKIKGNVKKSAKGTEYLENGQLQLGKNNVRVSWLRPDQAALDRGGLVFANLEVNRRDDKTYPQLTITDAVPVVTEQNVAYLRGTVKEVKEFNKILSVQFEYAHTNWSKETNKATVSVKVFDKAGAVGQALKAAAGKGEILVEAKLDPSQGGFIEFTALKVMSLSGTSGDGLELSTAADVPATSTEEDPF